MFCHQKLQYLARKLTHCLDVLSLNIALAHKLLAFHTGYSSMWDVVAVEKKNYGMALNFIYSGH